MQRGHVIGLERGIVRHERARIGVGRLVFGHVRDHDVKRHAELREQFATARRSGSEDQFGGIGHGV